MICVVRKWYDRVSKINLFDEIVEYYRLGQVVYVCDCDKNYDYILIIDCLLLGELCCKWVKIEKCFTSTLDLMEKF